MTSFDKAETRYFVIEEKMVRRLDQCRLLAAIILIVTVGTSPHARADVGVEVCPEGTEQFTEYRLYFGRNLGNVEVVSDAAWSAFLSDEITPRFGDGLTVVDAAGQWRDEAGVIVREKSKLVVVLTGTEDSGLQRTDEIVRAYKEAFAQEAVLRTISSVCASF
ncbi:MAG: DUF3574 domain-containing protein [Rhodospirillales bacterium]|nr:DUF3574 domain-containing protein [Rhodospirillales bacterium]